MKSSMDNHWRHIGNDRDGDSCSSDSAVLTKDSTTKIKKTRITASSFATILAEVIDNPDYEDAIHWSQDGKSFRVIPKVFTEKVLDQHMKGTKFSSFFRRLIRWGFERIVLDEFPMDAFVFRHAMFQRGCASLLSSLSPYHVSRGKRRNQRSSSSTTTSAIAKESRTEKSIKPNKVKVESVDEACRVVSRENPLLQRSITLPPFPSLPGGSSASILSPSTFINPRRQQLSDLDTATLVELLIRQQQQQQQQQSLLTRAERERNLDSIVSSLHNDPSLLSQRLMLESNLVPDVTDHYYSNHHNTDLLSWMTRMNRETQLRDVLLLGGGTLGRSAPSPMNQSCLNFNNHHDRLLSNTTMTERERLALLSLLLQSSSSSSTTIPNTTKARHIALP